VLDSADENSPGLRQSRRWAGSFSTLSSSLQSGRLAAIVTVFVLSRVAWMLIFQFGPSDFVTALCQRDCLWYVAIAHDGYSFTPHVDSFQADWAYFPAYPLAMRAVSTITGLSGVAAGTLISNVAIIAGIWLGCRYLERTRPGQSKAAFVVLALAGPYSFYLSTVYTEALAFLFVVAGFWYWTTDRPLRAGLVGALLSATRSVGVFIAFAFAIDFVVRYGRAAPRKLLGRPDLIVALLLVPLGLSAFMIYLYLHLGDAMAFSHAQVAWNRELSIPLIWLLAGLARPWDLLYLWDPTGYSYFYSCCWTVLGIGLLVWLGMQRRWAELTFGIFCVVLPLSTGLYSMPRFIACCPLFLFAVTDLLARLKGPAFLRLAILVVLAAINLCLLWAWFHGSVFVI
jgi:hypothetical protein